MPHEIIVVDDGSRDRTYEKVTAFCLSSEKNGKTIRLFKNETNQGKGYSIRRGIEYAAGDIVVIQDADTEYDPNEIPKLLEPLMRGEAEVVYGSRFLNVKRPSGMALPNYIANKILTLFTNLLYGLKLTDMETCYKLVKADILKSLPLAANGFSFEPEVTALLTKRGFSICELPIRYHGRTAEQGKKIKTRDFFYAVGTLLKYKVSSS